MSFRPDEKDWMAYLYGELDEVEKRKFDQYLLENPEASLEQEKFQNLRRILATVEEKEVIAPPIVFGNERGAALAGEQRYLRGSAWIKAVASIAASLILIILVGRMTGTQVSVSDREFRLSFGPVSAQTAAVAVPPNTITEADVRAMIDTSLERNNDEIQESLEKTRRKLDASIRNNLALNSGNLDQLVREASTASQEQIRQYVDGIRTENMQQVKDYFNLTSTEQKKYIENLLVDFAKYLQQQRNDDLRLVQMRMNNLEQNTDIFKQETEQIISSIITTVGVPVSGETKH